MLTWLCLKGKAGNAVVVSLIIIVALIVFWLIGVYNGLVTLKNRVSEAWSDIDVQLKRRSDLIPNLIETVKGYAKHETELLTKVTELRSAALSAKAPADRAAKEDMLVGVPGAADQENSAAEDGSTEEESPEDNLTEEDFRAEDSPEDESPLEDSPEDEAGSEEVALEEVAEEPPPAKKGRRPDLLAAVEILKSSEGHPRRKGAR